MAADLIFDLDHDHRVLGVRLTQVPHQCREGLAIRLERFFAQRRQGHCRAAIAAHQAGEALGITLNPFRRVGRFSILPAAKP